MASRKTVDLISIQRPRSTRSSSVVSLLLLGHLLSRLKFLAMFLRYLVP